MLALLGGAGGLLVAGWGLAYLLRLLPADLRHLERLTLNPAVLAFTVALGLATGLLFGLLPAFHAGRQSLIAGLREGAGQAGASRRRNLLRHALVGAQVTFALVLLAGAGWLIRSLMSLAHADPGFDAEGLVVVRIDLDADRSLTKEQRSAVAGTILEGLRGAGPAFGTVTLADRLPPGSSSVLVGAVEAEGRPRPPEEAQTMAPSQPGAGDPLRGGAGGPGAGAQGAARGVGAGRRRWSRRRRCGANRPFRDGESRESSQAQPALRIAVNEKTQAWSVQCESEGVQKVTSGEPDVAIDRQRLDIVNDSFLDSNCNMIRLAYDLDSIVTYDVGITIGEILEDRDYPLGDARDVRSGVDLH